MGWFTNLFYSPKPPAARHPQTPSSPPPSASSSIKRKEKEEEKKAEDDDEEEDDKEGSDNSESKDNNENKKSTVGTSARDIAAAERAKRIEMEELAAMAGREAAAKAAQRKVDDKLSSLLETLDTPPGMTSSSVVSSPLRTSSSSSIKHVKSERKVQDGKEEEEPPPPPPPSQPPSSTQSQSEPTPLPSSLSSPSLNVTSPTAISSPEPASVPPQVTATWTPSANNTTSINAPDNSLTTPGPTKPSTEIKPTPGVVTAAPIANPSTTKQPEKTTISGVVTPRPSSVDPSTLVYSPGAVGGEFERLFEDMELPGLPRLSQPSATTTSGTGGGGANATPATLFSDSKPIDPRKASHQLLQIGLASAELPASIATPATIQTSTNKAISSSSTSTTSAGVGVKGLLNSSAPTNAPSSAVKGGGEGGTKFVLNGTLRVIIHRLAKEVQRRTEAIHQLGAEILTLRKDLREARETLQQEQIAMREAEDVLLAETLRDVAPSILESHGGYSRINGEFNTGMSVGEEGSKVATVASARDLMNSLRRADPTGEMILPTVVRRLAVVAEKYVEQRRANALLVQEVRALRSASSSSSSSVNVGKPPLRPALTHQPREPLPPGSLDGAATSRSMFDEVDVTGGTSRGLGMLLTTASSSNLFNQRNENNDNDVSADELSEQLGSTLRHSGSFYQNQPQQTAPFFNSTTTSSSSSWNKIRGSVQAAQALKTTSNFSSLLASGAIGIHPHEPVTAAVHAELMDAHSVALSEIERLKDDAAMAHSVINELRTAHQAVQRTLTQTQAKMESDKRDREKLRDAIKVQQSLISKLESSLQNEHVRNDELIALTEEAREKEAESERRCRKLQLMLDDANEQLRDAIVSSNKHKKRAAALREEHELDARLGDSSRRETGSSNNNNSNKSYRGGGGRGGDDRKRYYDDDDDDINKIDENETNGRYKDRERERDRERDRGSSRPASLPPPPSNSFDQERFENTLQDLNKQIADQARQLAQAQDEIQKSKREARQKEEEEEVAKRRVSSDPLARSPGRQVETKPSIESGGDPLRGSSSSGSGNTRRGLSVFSLSKLSTSIKDNAAQRREERRY